MLIIDVETGEYEVDPLGLAASMLVLLPVLILFFVAQRQLVQGIAMTGLKG